MIWEEFDMGDGVEGLTITFNDKEAEKLLGEVCIVPVTLAMMLGRDSLEMAPMLGELACIVGRYRAGWHAREYSDVVKYNLMLNTVEEMEKDLAEFKAST